MMAVAVLFPAAAQAYIPYLTTHYNPSENYNSGNNTYTVTITGNDYYSRSDEWYIDFDVNKYVKIDYSLYIDYSHYVGIYPGSSPSSGGLDLFGYCQGTYYTENPDGKACFSFYADGGYFNFYGGFTITVSVVNDDDDKVIFGQTFFNDKVVIGTYAHHHGMYLPSSKFIVFDDSFFNRVGIGKDPTQALSVNGRIAVSQGTTASVETYQGALTLTKPNNGAQYINLARGTDPPWSIGTVYNTNKFAIGPAKTVDSQFTSPYLTITPDGNMGIGSTNPQSTLEVSGEVRILGSGVQGKPLTIVNESKTQSDQAKYWQIWNMTGFFGNSLQFWAYDKVECSGGLCKNRLTLMDNGNVGIGGIWDPKSTLDVNGAIHANEVKVSNNGNGAYFIGNEQDSGNRMSMRLWDTHAFLDYYPEMMIRTGIDNEHFRCAMKFNSEGYIGLGGLENPQYPLDVRGIIRATEVKIEVNSGADFVFSPDYNLKSLPEIESFIQENKHLPEIPSEKKMKEDGVSINEFQIKLLQKIEELTLYVIEQNKAIESLQKKNNELERRINEQK